MKDAYESPDGNEQVKPTTRSRTTARAKSDTQDSQSQEQAANSTVQRRTTPTRIESAPLRGATSTAPKSPARSQSTTNNTSAPSSPTRSIDTRTTNSSTGAQQAPLRRANADGNSTTQARSTASNVNTPAPVQRSAPAQRPVTQPVHRTGAGNPQGTPLQRQPGTMPTQRPTGPAGPSQRTGTRPANGSQGAVRPAGPGHPAPARPGPQGHPGAARPTARPTTPGQRPQERRTAPVKEKPTGPVSIPPQIVVKDLATLLHATPNEIIRDLIKHGIFASINQVVDYEKAALVAQELGFEPQASALTVAPAVQREKGLSANEAMMATRNEDNMVVIPPVVTIMGHVDHGKTSLLDTIRKTKVAAGEAGGITQHIGAYQVEVNGKKITFLDTPGHEAFTAMRARGAQVTHIAIIVVAADDGVMPQTREAIDHANAAKVPIIIALNKIDKANANPDHVKQQLAEIGVVIEEYGGDVICVPVSARKGTGIDDLLEMILLVAELQEIKANPNRPATGVIIEARLEKNTGPIATVLVQQGTLKMGDNIVVGALSGKVRAMFNDRGKRIQKASPSTPVSIMGLPEVPQAGDRLEVVADERTAKQRALQVAEQRRDENMPLGQVSLDTLYMQMQEGKTKELNVVLKSDVQGSSEAIKNALSKLGEENIKVRLIHEGIGNINETDVHLASASGAVIIGFNVKADGAAQRQAQKEGVEIRFYNVIYQLIDDIQAALTGMLEPTLREVIEGHAEVLQTFKAGKTTVIAGCRITDGKITRSAQARILRKNTKVYDGKIASLRRGKDDVREVATGYECGIVLEDFTEFEVGDIIEAFTQERVKPGA
jgi:translation initiation factor IF-2